jgi:hypothetical protein
MYITRSSWTNRSGKTYSSIWLKESFRENGKVNSRYILNLKDWPDEAINALQLAINACNKADNSSSCNSAIDKSASMKIEPQQIRLEQGFSVGALFITLASNYRKQFSQAFRF